MKILYTLNGVYFCECEENSLMDKVLKDIIRRDRERQSKEAQKLISQSLPVYIKRKEHKDILFDVRET